LLLYKNENDTPLNSAWIAYLNLVSMSFVSPPHNTGQILLEFTRLCSYNLRERVKSGLMASATRVQFDDQTID
jgi:hypothetical protein